MGAGVWMVQCNAGCDESDPVQPRDILPPKLNINFRWRWPMGE